MKKFNLYIENNGEAFILFLSIISLFTGILLSIILVFKTIFLNYHITEIEVKFIIILIAGGLLGSVLDFVLKKHLKDYVEKYIDNGKIETILAKIDENNRLLKEEQEVKTEKDEKKENNPDYDKLDTVIVPVAWTYDAVITNREYRCPSNRTFKENLKYIAFYKDKNIIGYGALFPGYNTKIGEDKIFKFERFIEKIIPHISKGAYVQNKIYCEFEKLKIANTTSEIRLERRSEN